MQSNQNAGLRSPAMELPRPSRVFCYAEDWEEANENLEKICPVTFVSCWDKRHGYLS